MNMTNETKKIFQEKLESIISFRWNNLSERPEDGMAFHLEEICDEYKCQILVKYTQDWHFEEFGKKRDNIVSISIKKKKN
jgi:hypothetical protein